MASINTTDNNGGWRNKARRIIAVHCMAAYLASNKMPNGSIRKRHLPYSVPPIAAALVAALADDDEYEIKRLFIVESTGADSLI